MKRRQQPVKNLKKEAEEEEVKVTLPSVDDLRIKDDATIDDGEESPEDSDGDVESEEDSGNSEEEVIEYATDEDPEEEEEEEEDVDDVFPLIDRKKDEEAEEDIQQNQAFYQRYHKDGSTYFGDDSSSDEEWGDTTKNRVGQIPMEYYKDYDHIGYNLEGKKIGKPEETKDSIDKFLDMTDNPDYYRTVWDDVNQREVVLSKEDFDIVKMIVKKKTLTPLSSDDFYLDSVPNKNSIHPVTNIERRKAAFLPNTFEIKKINRILRAMEKGLIKIRTPQEIEEDKEEQRRNATYELWGDDGKLVEDVKRRTILPVNRVRPPMHAESYNPPPEYILNEKELKLRKKWADWHGKRAFIPQKYNSLHEIPSYPLRWKEMHERFQDLMHAARMKPKPKKYFSMEQLLPDLPKPEELRPYPTSLSIIYEGHTKKVRCVSVDPTGQWIVTGSDDKTARIWEVSNGRCCHLFHFDEPVVHVAWNPNPSKHVIAIATDTYLFIANAMVGIPEVVESCDEMFERIGKLSSSKKAWFPATQKHQKTGIRFKLVMKGAVEYVSWHKQGDYLISVSPDNTHKNEILLVHQLSTKKTQHIFKNPHGKITCAKFHPSRPLIYVATQTAVKIYNLSNMTCEKKFKSGVKYISSIDIHPKGDNFILSSYDKKVAWFDEELSTKAYKTMKYHRAAVRKVAFHPSYPLFASCSDDLHVQIFHASVYDELDKNAMIVPLRILRGHTEKEGLGVLDLCWHPSQPWIFSAGGDHTVRLWV
ncbi:ribosome biogenesis protein bop1-like [Planoprotostelium fungivorum]|uniref:Ribosome biogenesis protein bop1-like n=1 Tax=Planoprotostelium fungivorum TaxID=1890364 RepID=A0A2P6MVC6_9EUKA|nr:ribosome biogenesis protein bop1-like [Planoprotostelium fungivorum]